jgi:CBS-domain-containing membrane protein
LYLTIETINGINNKDLKKYKQKLDEIVDIKCKELEEELRRLSNLKNDVNLILYGRW